MSVGKRVVVIHDNHDYDCDDIPFPPIGTLGTVVSPLDEWDEYDVRFDNHPFPFGDDNSWVTHKSMIVFIDEDFNREFLENDQKIPVNC